MDRSLGGFQSRLLGHDKTTRNDVLEDISISLATLLRCEKGKRLQDHFHILSVRLLQQKFRE